ncbi:hypothetical protein VTL71DRAFT_2104 [Oculimacula yallundae]|uniref:N-acetyltransferase domain-containing protein n=1 Tax=Oculimacula yallundae TaxID=86028 RepID=A0ABR4C7Y0_9HELO
MATSPEPQLKVSLATPSDLPSIGTLHARAFHAKSAWHLKTFPPSVSTWWIAKYTPDISDPAVHLLKVSSPSSPNTVIGLLCLRKYTANERGAGRWSTITPSTEQVDPEIYAAMIKSMLDYRVEYMLGRDHFCIDHFGVDSQVQGKGFGGLLLGRACEIADEEGVDVFVMANEHAVSFYEKFEFMTEGREIMKGGMVECFLVRRYGVR